MSSLKAALDYLHADISIIPIAANGSKKPMVDWAAFQHERPTETAATGWFKSDVGIGIVCGAVSGLEVIDFDDLPSFERWRVLCPGNFCIIATPRPGRQVILHRAAPAHNQKLARRNKGEVLIETRGEGGYILAPGSPLACHKNGTPYTHIEGPSIVEVRCSPPITDMDYAKLIAAARMLDEHVDPQHRSRAGDDFNARATWEEILSPHGWEVETEHDTWKLWRRPGKDSGGSATTGYCGELLKVFSTNAPPFEGERAYSKFAAYTLLNHGGDFKAAARALRGVAPEAAHAPTTKLAETRDVLVPGAHVMDGGEYVEVSPGEFARKAIEQMPDLYSRAKLPGELIANEFCALTEHRARILAADHCRFLQCSMSKGEEPEPVKKFVAATRDMGALIVASAADHPRVRRLENIVTYPVFDAEWKLCEPGYSGTTFYAEPSALKNLKPTADVEIFNDLLCDFSFASEADRQTYIGALLTPLVRPAITGNVPMYLIGSPIERCGKTKLASEVLGGVYLGHPVPAMQITGGEDERDKRILGLLLSGTRLVHFDNLADMLDSAVLSSLLTSSTYQGRILGRTEIVSVPNAVFVVATGNNIRATGEISKRTLPVLLLPNTDHPELRTDFRHPNIAAYAVAKRRSIIEALIGMVLKWRAAQEPRGRLPFGGFDRYAEVVGGILACSGFTEWAKNASSWREGADDFSADLASLVAIWAQREATQNSTALLAIAKDNELFPWCFTKPSDRAHQTAFGMGVMRKSIGRVVLGYRIQSLSSGNNRLYLLKKVP